MTTEIKELVPGEYARLEDIPADQIVSVQIMHEVNVGDIRPGVRFVAFVYAKTGMENDYPLNCGDPGYSINDWSATNKKTYCQNTFYFEGLSFAEGEAMIRQNGWRGEIRAEKRESFNGVLPALDECAEAA